ncbi:MAG TPA: cytochrome C [Casimicrobiaceae bacterium]|nr:cytochrome C [Casimicrobiaceae bacterium]
MKSQGLGWVAVIAAAVGISHAVYAADAPNASSIARGRYIAKIGGCNDCHTAGYAEKGGKVPEREWLLGDRLGYRGGWGTTYPSNLRMLVAGMTQAQWMKYARTLETRPPMPWFNMRAMTDADLRALYVFIKSLGPVGERAPIFLPPGAVPSGPVVQFPG